MNCPECQENLSKFIDGELDLDRSSAVIDHLAVCAQCTLLRDDLAEILLRCGDGENGESAPPNSAALWRRINNLIESELPPEKPAERMPTGLFSRVWRLSLSQAGIAVLCIALLSSLLTVVAIRNYFEPPGNDLPARSSEPPTLMQRIFSKIGLAETPHQARERRVREQQAAIEYWDKRVRMRRANWDERMSAAFDRNLREIDQAVSEYTLILLRDPEDQLSEEMLDSALTEKMNLLRQFAEL